MTYNEAKKYKINDRIHPRLGKHEYTGAIDTLGNLIITRIDDNRVDKKITFTCNNGDSYDHKKVNGPILYAAVGLTVIGIMEPYKGEYED